MRPETKLVLMVFALIVGSSLAGPESVSGNWSGTIIFGNGESRSLRFHADATGEGFFLPAGPAQNWASQTAKWPATWTEHEKDSVTFSGVVEFPLGNVGLEKGTLILKGKLEGNDAIAGEARFFEVGQDPTKTAPAKSGTFKAVRTTD